MVARIGRYRLEQPIGIGGSSTVFRAVDERTGAVVALKRVPKHEGEVASTLAPMAEVLTSVSSPHLVRVLDSGEDDEDAWVAMELVDGVALSSEVLGRSLLPHEVLRVARCLLQGLAALHGAGLVHGDVKPSNVLVPLGGRALGALKLVDGGAAPAPSTTARGTLRYASPERVRGRTVEPSDDLFAVGVVLSELLGLEADSEALRASVPTPLGPLLARLVEVDPALRPRDALAALHSLADVDTAEDLAQLAESSPLGRALSPTVPPMSERHPRVAAPSQRPPRAARPPTRLTRLPAPGGRALIDALRAMDVPMLDALARREKGNVIGRLSRCTSLALRLELDAAALVLEPMCAQSALARAMGAALLSPVAKRASRARIDDESDEWASAVDAEVCALFVVLGAALDRNGASGRSARRLDEMLRRLRTGDEGDPVLRETVRVAQLAARVRAGLDGAAFALEQALELTSGAEPALTIDRYVRALAVAAIAARIDGETARQRAVSALELAQAAGAPLLEVVASLDLATVMAFAPEQQAQVEPVVARATCIAAHGESPSLSQEGELAVALSLLASAKHEDAAVALAATRATYRAELSPDADATLQAMLCFSRLAGGEVAGAAPPSASLRAGPRSAVLVALARATHALVVGASADDATRELTRAAEAASAHRLDDVDLFLLGEVLHSVAASTGGAEVDLDAKAMELAHREHAERAFGDSWLEVLHAAFGHAASERAEQLLGALAPFLVHLPRAARERRTHLETSPPPPVSHR